MDATTENSGSQVIARAALILKALENQLQGLTLSELARRTGLPRTTVHRLTGALEAQQLVVNGVNGVRLGPALARLAASAHVDIVSLSRPALEALSHKTRETVDLCVYRGQHAISVAQYASDRELRVVSSVGTAFPCHCTAHGKAMLAALDDNELLHALDQPLEQRTHHSLVSKDKLLKEIDEIRQQGYAIDHQEHAEGVCGLGAVLRSSSSQQLYAMSLAVPALRFEAQFEFLLSTLLQSKAEVEALG